MAGGIVAVAKVLLTADNKQLKASLRDAKGELSKYEKSGQSLAKRMEGANRAANIALGGIALGVGKAVKSASDLSESINKNQVVFGQASKGILAWSQTTAKSIGISRQQALEATGVFGNMLKPLGIAPAKAGEMSQKMVQLAADMASFNNADPSETLDALRAGLAGEAEPLRKFGVSLNETRIKAEALALGLVKPVKNMEEIKAKQIALELATRNYTKAVKEHGQGSEEALRAEAALIRADEALKKSMDGKIGTLDASTKAQATYSLVMKDTTDAQGDFARTADGAANSQRIIKAQFEDTAAKLGTAFLPIFETVLGKLSDFADWASNHTGVIKGAAGAIAAVALSIKAIKVASTTISGVQNIAGALSRLAAVKNAGAAADAVSGIAAAGTRGGLLGKTAGTLGRIARVALGPWGLLAAAGVGGLAYAITRLNQSGPNKVERALDALDKTTRRLAGSMRFAETAADRLVDAELAAERAALGVKQATQAEATARDELSDATRALNKLVEKGITDGPKLEAAKQRVTDAELSLEDATLALTEAKRAQELADRDAAKASDIAAGSLAHARQVSGEAVHSTLMLTGRTREMTSAFEGTQRQVQITARELPGYIAKLRETATHQMTAGTTAGRFAGLMADLTEKLNRVPTKTETKIVLQGAQAGITDLSTLVRYMKWIKDHPRLQQAIDIYVSTHGGNPAALGPTSGPPGFAGGVVGTFATGGEVPMGRGGLGRDSVLAWLRPGELVLNERQQAVFGGKRRLKRMLGLATGGSVPAPDPAPRFGTYWVGGRFVTHNPNVRHFWDPDSDEFSTKNRAFPNPPKGPHVGKLYGKAVPPIAFRFWQQWWGRKQWEGFLRQGARHGLGPGWARRFASEHPLAAKLLWLHKNVPSGARWPWEAPDPATAGIPGGPVTAPVGTGSAYQRVVAALNFARAVAAKRYGYNYGGGHNASFAPSGGEKPPGYDCSGFVSAVLHRGSMMRGGPYTSAAFYPGGGAGMVSGPGKWVSVWTWGTSGRSGHVFMDILGNRMEAGRYGGGGGYAGARSSSGFTVSHPAGYAAGGMVGRVPVLVKPGELIVDAGPALNARIARRLGFRGRPGRARFETGGVVGRIPEGDAATAAAAAASGFEVATSSGTYEPKLVAGKCFRWGKQYWGAAIGHGKGPFVTWAKEHGKTEGWVTTVFQQNHPELYKSLTNASYTIPEGSRQRPLPGYGPAVDPDEELPGEPIDDPEDPGGDPYPEDPGGDYPSGGDDTGGGPSAAEIQAQIAEAIAREASTIWGARSRFMSEFAPNVFSPSAAGLQLGSSPLGRPNVTVIQNMPAPVEDPFVLARRAAIAARGAF